MKAVIGVDGSKYSEWALRWLGRIPFRTAPRVTAIHASDLNSARAPKEMNCEQPDLIVTGAKERSAVARYLQGSVSTRLVHQSVCSILIVR